MGEYVHRVKGDDVDVVAYVVLMDVGA